MKNDFYKERMGDIVARIFSVLMYVFLLGWLALLFATAIIMSQ